MEKLKSIAKSIWAKIPKTKTEFKDLFDKSVSFLERWLHKIWVFLKSAYAWIINFYQEHSKLIHKCLYAIAILIWFAVLVIILINLYELYFAKEKPDSWASEVRIAVFTLAAWFGTLFLVWRTMLAAEQTKTAEKQANTAQEKAYTELFTQAVEQLGSVKPVGKDQYEVNIEVRIGALYALERIMKDSDKDAKTIIDTLSTYIKQNCGDPKYFEEEITEEEVTKLQENASANRYDIQTALIIIGRRPVKYKTKGTMPDLTKVNLQGADLVNFDLSLCNLANAHLDGAKLRGAELQEANLDEANLRGAELQEADLQGAELQRANLQEAKLQEAEFQEANLLGANLKWTELYKANLQGANLLGSKLQGAFLLEANLQRANLKGAKLDEVHIYSTHKTAASVIRIDFTKAKYDFDILQEQVKEMFGHKHLTILPKDSKGIKMEPPDHWSEADMDSAEGDEQYLREWEAFKKEKGVE